jgi:hypothetical protein
MIRIVSVMVAIIDIARWRSTYAATQIYRGPVKFVLSASGISPVWSIRWGGNTAIGRMR